MAAMTDLVLSDAASVARTFVPSSKDAGVLDIWNDTSSGIRVGFPVASIGSRAPSKTARTSKITLKLVRPTLEQPSPSGGTGFQPAPTVAYSNLVNVEFVFHERSTLVERQDLLAQIRDFINEAIVTTACESYAIPT